MADIEKLGEAFEKAVTKRIRGPDESSPKRKKSRSYLLNPVRMKILSALCKWPCRSLSVLSESLTLPKTTLRWHLSKLMISEYITSKNIGKRKIFYPASLLLDEEIELLYLFCDMRVRIIYNHIRQNPNSTRQEIFEAKKIDEQVIVRLTNHLEEMGLIKSMRGGRFKTYNITHRMESLASGNKNRAIAFREKLIENLKNEDITYKIEKTNSEQTIIYIKAQKEWVGLVIHTDPFVTILAD